MREKLGELIAESIKSGKKDVTEVLRAIKSAFTVYEKTGKTLGDNEELGILLGMKKDLEKDISEFRGGGRMDLVEKGLKELEILNTYIPAQPTDEDIKKYAEEVCKEFPPTSMKDMGMILGKVKERYPVASGKIVSEVVKNEVDKNNK